MLAVRFGIIFSFVRNQWHARIGLFSLDLDCYQIPLSAPVLPYLNPTAIHAVVNIMVNLSGHNVFAIRWAWGGLCFLSALAAYKSLC